MEATAKLLMEEGSEGLTLRKVASRCGISLSNLQYYYPGKTALLQAMAAHFFRVCEERVLAERDKVLHDDPASAQVFLKRLLTLMIVCELDDFYHVLFRELWALAARDATLAEGMRTYYCRYAAWLTSQINELFPRAETITSLLIPYSEGVALVGDAMPVSNEAMVSVWYQLITGQPDTVKI